MSDTKKCPNCQEDIPAIALKCEHCGKSLLEDDDSGELATSLYWDGLGGQQTHLSDTPVQEITDPFEKIRSVFSAKYDITEEVGRGGMAIVYRAIQKNLNREVALKVLPEQFVHDEEYIIRFHREAREVAKMNHPNIVTIFDEGEIDGQHYLAMEFLEGKDLHDILKAKENLSASEIENVIAPIAEALDYVHGKGLVHRDIKGSNIFVLNNGRAVLTDFGIAKTSAKTKLTQVGSIIGTPEYMCPEQADGREVDGRGDLYSLGVVMYESLTGRVPFKADNPITLIRKIIEEKPVSPRKLNSDIPKWLDEIILKCLEKDPGDRIQSGEHLSQSLREHKVIVGIPTKLDVTATLNVDSGKAQKISVKDIPKLDKKTSGTKPKDKSPVGIILLILVLVIIGGGAAAYFMGYFDTAKPETPVTNTPANNITNNQQSVTSGTNTVPIVADSSEDSTQNTLTQVDTSESNQTDSIVSQEEKPVEAIDEQKPTEAEIKAQEEAKRKLLRLNLLETKLAQAKLEVKDKERKYNHAKRMRERNLISPSDFNKAKDAYENALQEVKKLEREISSLR